MNWQLMSFVFTIASGVTIGIFMTVALIFGFNQIPQIIIAVIAGLAVSLPITYVVANKLQSLGITKDKSAINAA